MYFLYDIAVKLVYFFLKIPALFNPKLKLFVRGRQHTFPYLKEKLSGEEKVIWIHAASLGEFEQGLPVMQQLKASYPDHLLLVSFFSPSGYEVKKHAKVADLVCYLPLDTKANVKKFISLVRPRIVLFIKYEIWPNYLRYLRKENIPVLLISAIFRKKQVFFKWYGGFMKKALKNVSYFFVQDENSKNLLNTLGFSNCTLSGDTRFDRVSEILARNNSLDFMEEFKGTSTCIVAGSTWPEDETFIVDYINNSSKKVKYVLAPHNIKEDHIRKLQSRIDKRTLLFTEREGKRAGEFEVLILNTIGLLTKVYFYADIAYVGGGFETGLHNTLEPAVFGIPVVIGPHYEGFKEVEDLVRLGGIKSVDGKQRFTALVNHLISDSSLRKTTGQINKVYIDKNTGASVQIMQHIRKLL